GSAAGGVRRVEGMGCLCLIGWLSNREAAHRTRCVPSPVHGGGLGRGPSCVREAADAAAIERHTTAARAVDKAPSKNIDRPMFRPATLTLLLAIGAPAAAMVGGAAPVSEGVTRAIVIITGSRGNLCTGTALARDLVLTAAHCVAPAATYIVL